MNLRTSLPGHTMGQDTMLSHRRFVVWFAIAGIAITLNGCTGTRPLDLQNPFASPPPAYKSQYGLTPSQKVDRLRALTDQIAGMGSAQQINVGKELVATLKKERDPILRRELVRAIGALGVPQAAEGLHFATDDENPQVRIAACEAWGRRNSAEASGTLAAILNEDSDVDVRLAASQALARRPQNESLMQLAATLRDRDPAVQLATMSALREATGANIRNDVNDWLAFLNTRSNNMAAPPNPLKEKTLPIQTDAETQLASGIESKIVVEPPVYEDFNGGAVFR